jgi:hypothetical protein
LSGKGDDENVVVNKMRFIDCINGVNQEHSERSECRTPHFTIEKNIKKGVTARIALKCTNCDFLSSVFKLYNEIPKSGRGSKPAAVNVGL